MTALCLMIWLGWGANKNKIWLLSSQKWQDIVLLSHEKKNHILLPQTFPSKYPAVFLPTCFMASSDCCFRLCKLPNMTVSWHTCKVTVIWHITPSSWFYTAVYQYVCWPSYVSGKSLKKKKKMQKKKNVWADLNKLETLSHRKSCKYTKKSVWLTDLPTQTSHTPRDALWWWECVFSHLMNHGVAQPFRCL